MHAESSLKDNQEDCSSRTSSSSGRRTTRELFLTSTATPRRRNETDEDFLARITHLRLQNKGLSTLKSSDLFEACPSLKVLYLYDNCLESLQGVAWLRQLEQLYVDNNALTTIDQTLSSCGRLTKLHLSGNMIRRVSGLESTRCLEELYLAKQRLPLGEALTFDQASIDGIKGSLVVLDASGNGIVDEDVAPLLELYRLEILNLADNAIEDIAQVVNLLTSLENIKSCDLRGNGASRAPKYFERAVTRSGDNLSMLDGKPVHAQHREMLRKLDQHTRRKRAHSRKKQDSASFGNQAPIAEISSPSQAWVELDERTVGEPSTNTIAKKVDQTPRTHRSNGPRTAWTDARRVAAVPSMRTISNDQDDGLQLTSWPS